MFIGIFASDQDITRVCEAAWESAENLVDEPLECLCSVDQAKRHPDKFEESKWGGDGCLRNVLQLHWNLVVCPHQVYL